MAMLETKHEKRSFTITVVIYVVLIFLLLFFGLTYLDPPPENGIAINFGTSEVGSGTDQPKEPVKSAPKKSTAQPVKSEPVIEKEVVTQDIEEAPVIEKKKKETPVKTKQPEKVKEPEKPVKKPEPKPDKSTNDALSSILNGPERSGKETGGEGNDNEAGDKGRQDGDPNASSYYGQGAGLDGDGNYRLGGRKALNKEKFLQECNQSGLVVVRIEVNRQGQVISANPGVKGTTNSSPCLIEPAKRAAMATKFNSDPNAPSRQVGTIIYNFKLSE